MIACEKDVPWYLERFSSYAKILRMIAWVLRFTNNSRRIHASVGGELSAKEISTAELLLCKLAQKESFMGVNDPRLRGLNVFEEKGIMRIKTAISNRQDTFCFRYPIVLDSKHLSTRRVILYTHLKLNHAGTEIVMNNLREKFWILRYQRTVRSIVHKCTACRRHAARNMEAPFTPLPENRVREAAAFEVVGIDYADPLFLKEGCKAYICLFTCAVYRAVHLELVTSLSTEEFIEAFRRFIARRGRPSVVYSDNGRNFVGLANLLRKINWQKIQRYCSLSQIEWNFNPPSAAWWGGWWERLIRILKDLLRRTLRRTSLSYEEMNTVLCDCEAVMNSRPLTYMTEESTETMAITPDMFIRDVKEAGVPDLDQISKTNFAKRIRYRQSLKEELRRRFRIQYLGLLSRRTKCKNSFTQVAVGDVVLVGNDTQRRLDWPLAIVKEVFPGKDGHTRVVRLKTEKGELIRPIQRLIPLEVGHHAERASRVRESIKASPQDGESPESAQQEKQESVVEEKPESVPTEETDLRTRSGRLIKKPERFEA